MNKIKDIIIKINKIIEKIEPNRLFYEIKSEYISYDKPKIEGDMFGIFTNSGTLTYYQEYTRVGQWLEKLPFIIYLLVTTPYYIIAWPLYFVILIIWSLFKGVFVPQSWEL